MGDIVNLRLFKKQKERKNKEQIADQNRQIHGRTKVEKIFDKRNQDQSEKFLDRNHLQPDDKKV
ncbi:DUF4169 family protein [Bartonella sp. HY329]|uniref:DUF4169 family protein n=1 Tax=unclassified Bartonella TaxID=2645622 RepID=UPI0021C70075|nr:MULTISPECIES: DUF4169 family protein [unclassified Bartonella]UXM94532.1 DUF4169 family protein [Bartonella sp. HY329]UXN08856.1 DUF4169 family protein [Bartonella sp. HY328]